MNSIGEALRRERLRRNLDLEQVAKETKINVKLLEAIEAEDFSKLPGGVFAKSFVRQYARLLGLDEEEMVAELQRSFQPASPAAPEESVAEAPPPIEVPRVPDWASSKPPRSSSSLPALAGMVVVMLICAAVYAWWQRASRPEVVPPVAETSERAPTAQAPPAAVPESPAATPQRAPGLADNAQSARQQPADASAQPGGTAPQSQNASSVSPPSATERGSAPVPPGNAPAQPPLTAAQASGGETAAGNVRVMITAQEPTWVSARSDGRVVYSGTLQANEKKDLSAAGEVRLVVGNAGGVSIELNGKPVPPLGPRGQVRVVQFSPGGVQIVPRKPPGPDSL